MPCHELENDAWMAYQEACNEGEFANHADGEQWLWDTEQDRLYRAYAYPIIEAA